MKKYIISSFVIVTFAVYVLYQRVSGVGDVVVINNPSGSTAGQNVPAPVVPADNTNSPSPSTVPSGEREDDGAVGFLRNLISAPAITPKKTVKKTTTPVSTTPTQTPAPVKVTNTGLYRDGSYTGSSVDAYYGNIQVATTISGGRIIDVQFLDYPQDRGNSVRINTYAMPILRQEAIQAQSANVSTVSGASYSSEAFRQSIASALAQAKN